MPDSDLNQTALPLVSEKRRRPAMAPVRRTATLPLAFVVCVLVVAGVAATPTGSAGESLTAAAAQDASDAEASLALDRSTRRLTQQGLRNQRFAPGPPDGLFGPRTRAAAGTGTVQLPPEILVDRHLVRVERLLADGDPAAALEAMNEVLALQQEYDLVLQDGFRFQYAQVAYSAGRTETTIAALNEYLVVAGREGEFYREALELLDSAELRLQQEETERRRARRRAEAERRRAEAERRRAEAERRHAARWPPGHVFRDCETCPQMVVLRGSVVALGQYEVTVGEYRAFASATGLGAADCDGNSWRNPGFPQTDHHPVTCVSWDEAQTYVSWLSRQTGAPYRLPTEAEWERAAAASQPGCDQLGRGTGPDGTCPVGQYGTNAAGLSDMVGNVWEWTSNCWEDDCGRRVTRGGSWGNDPDYLRPDARGWTAADHRLRTLGIRVARMLE